ncbi:DUF6233 domain-containing protein [Streptomyces sp. NPDC014793]|uniref:DUF6233 domain-containing protein n=1 Tax=Streptomyces sp. NPDC014793 TaxID=3364914 RepID=UPI0036FB6D53
MEKQLPAGHPLGADCTVIQRDANPISADDGRQALTGDGMFFHACEFCRSDAHLGFPLRSGGGWCHRVAPRSVGGRGHPVLEARARSRLSAGCDNR